jgi:hypothetical protein
VIVSLLDPKYGEPYKVKLVVANEETLKGYGKIVTDFDKEEVEITPWPVNGWRKLYPGTGAMGGIVCGAKRAINGSLSHGKNT